MIGKANHYGSHFAAEKQRRHFAERRKPVETQRMLYGIMIGKANHYSLSKKDSDVSGLTRPWLYAFERADSSLLFPQLLIKNKVKR